MSLQEFIETNHAKLHGHDLLGLGFSVNEMVHDHGDVCQAVTELAVELDAAVSVADFHTLNRCLDNAIASAVTAWTGDRERMSRRRRKGSALAKMSALLGTSLS